MKYKRKPRKTRYKEYIKLKFFRKDDMSKAGVNAWTPALRNVICRKVNTNINKYYFDRKALRVHVYHLRNKTAIKRFVTDVLPDGEYYARGWQNRRTVTGKGYTDILFRWEKFTTIKDNGQQEVYVSVEVKKRMYNYYFWGKSKQELNEMIH